MQLPARFVCLVVQAFAALHGDVARNEMPKYIEAVFDGPIFVFGGRGSSPTWYDDDHRDSYVTLGDFWKLDLSTVMNPGNPLSNMSAEYNFNEWQNSTQWELLESNQYVGDSLVPEIESFLLTEQSNRLSEFLFP